MGNNHSNVNGLSKVKNIGRRSRKSSSSNHEAFFIAHHKAQIAQIARQQHEESSPLASVSPTTQSNNIDDNQIDLKKRVIFVSLMGLFNSWRHCPSTILYSSIFILPMKKQWVYSNKYEYQHEFGRVLHDSDFVKLLKWKDCQGLVFWMKDAIPMKEYQHCITPATPDFVRDQDIDFEDEIPIAPFWNYLSYKLTLLYDPVTGNNYKPLLLNDDFWKRQYQLQQSYFDTTPIQIRKELYFLTMKFKTISEILYQSNQTLHIVTTWISNDTGSCNQNSKLLSSECSQKSYNSLPDRLLVEMYQNSTKCKINVNDESNSLQEIALNGEITPNPHYFKDNNNDDDDENKDENEDENIWWISPDYAQVIDVHDNDKLYRDDELFEDNDNPLLFGDGLMDEQINKTPRSELVERKTI